MVSEGEQRISLLMPSRLLMKTPMRNSEAVAEAVFLSRWVVDFFFSMRDAMTLEAGFADWGFLG